MAPKTTCPVSRSQFTAKAKPLVLTIDGTRIAVPVKDFSTGSMGWYANGKTTIEVDGVLCTVQMGLTFTVVGSKELPPATSTNGTPVASAIAFTRSG